MSMQDPISDMLTRIRNALAVNKKTVSIPYSKHKQDILAVLTSEGYLTAFEKAGETVKATLEVTLKYHNEQAVISKLMRKSKPSLRVYRGKAEIPTVLDGLGVAIVSTNQGVMSDRKARRLGVGGEILCFVE